MMLAEVAKGMAKAAFAENTRTRAVVFKFLRQLLGDFPKTLNATPY